MDFFNTLFFGYVNPDKFSKGLRNKPAPYWGFFAQILRGFLDSLLVFLPVALLGRHPSTPSFLTFLPTETYYFSLVWLTPLFFLFQWLFGASVFHLFFRLCKRTSNIDQILNITGMASLVIGAFLVAWDWLWFFIGFSNQYFLGISHLVIDIWWIVLVVYGLKRILGLPFFQSTIACVLALMAAMPFAIIIMRAPF